MLYCQPQSFYDEMKFISEKRKDFLQKIDLSEYKLPSGVENIDPVQYLIKMVLCQPTAADYKENIFALRTYGSLNGLVPKSNDRIMSVYYAMLYFGTLYITKPQISIIEVINNEVFFEISDEYGDTSTYSIDDISNSVNGIYSKNAYINYHEDVFNPSNLMAMIPLNLIENLV